MSSHAWQLEKHTARLKLGRLAARVDLTRPAHGLVDVRTTFGSPGNACLLGIEIPAFTAGNADTLVARYARGEDLLATYKESEAWPVRVDALWRAESADTSTKFFAAVELVLSVRTCLPDSRPDLAVQSSLPAAKVLRAVDPDATRFEPWTSPAATSTTPAPAGGPGCLVFRLPESELSYAEMVHPADFQHDELTGATDASQAVRVRHRLFCRPLEKGVIFRARVRGVFLPRHGDTQNAAECYAAFAAAEPPLGT